MQVNTIQVEASKEWINRLIGEQFPGVGIGWKDDPGNGKTTPSIYIPPILLPQQNEIIAVAKTLISIYMPRTHMPAPIA